MVMMVKTLAGIKAELQGNSGTTPSYDTTLTLNAKYGIAASTKPAVRPVSRYIGIGIGGKYNVDGTNKTQEYTPQMLNLDLYQPIPFRCVRLSEDLPAAEMINYRMRVPKRIDGIDYVLYYLKVVTMIDNEIQVTQTNPTTHEETPFVQDPSYLNPIPIIPRTSGVVGTRTTEINVTLNSTLNIMATEVLQGIDILFGGDRRLAVLSEIGLYYGADFQQNGVDKNGTTFKYTETAMTQLGYHACTNGFDMSDPATYIAKTIRQGKTDVTLL